MTAPPFKPPKPAPQATRVADPASCARFGTGCDLIPVASPASGSGSSCFIMCGWSSFGRKALSTVGNVTGITDAINCIKNPTLATCAKAALKLTATAITIATLGAGAESEVAADGAADVVGDLTADGSVSTGEDATAEAGGDSTAEADTEAAGGEGKPPLSRRVGRAFGAVCTAVALTCGGGATVATDVGALQSPAAAATAASVA